MAPTPVDVPPPNAGRYVLAGVDQWAADELGQPAMAFDTLDEATNQVRDLIEARKPGWSGITWRIYDAATGETLAGATDGVPYEGMAFEIVPAFKLKVNATMVADGGSTNLYDVREFTSRKRAMAHLDRTAASGWTITQWSLHTIDGLMLTAATGPDAQRSGTSIGRTDT